MKSQIIPGSVAEGVTSSMVRPLRPNEPSVESDMTMKMIEESIGSRTSRFVPQFKYIDSEVLGKTPEELNIGLQQFSRWIYRFRSINSRLRSPDSGEDINKAPTS